ncbi:hypothetical protein [Neptunicella marina]|uniref:Uncharacterized protein n=1 Tax=Neptunicella marina TaxID=2125989 RepID=A0A8J6ISI6_9ALTE|nr:hypothetical protein [Neptunicella marina]MBC3764608.1 hypothetical protein [Neptunicella marina]
MQINSNNPVNRLYNSVFTLQTHETANNQLQKANQTTQNVTADNEQAEWQQIAARFDVTNISTSERAELAGQLAEKGLISSEMQLKLAAPSSMNDDFQTKTNFLAEMQNSQQVQQGDPLALKTLKVLQQLNGFSTGSDGSQVWQGYAQA